MFPCYCLVLNTALSPILTLCSSETTHVTREHLIMPILMVEADMKGISLFLQQEILNSVRPVHPSDYFANSNELNKVQ